MFFPIGVYKYHLLCAFGMLIKSTISRNITNWWALVWIGKRKDPHYYICSATGSQSIQVKGKNHLKGPHR